VWVGEGAQSPSPDPIPQNAPGIGGLW